MTTSRITFALFLLAAACRRTEDPGGPGTLDRSPAREDAAYVVLRDTVTFAVSAGGFFTGRVPYRFTNRGDRAVAVNRCRTPYPPDVEVSSGGQWRRAWSGVVLLCYEPPLVIAPGATHTDTVVVSGCMPEAPSCSPRWEVGAVTSTARLRWALGTVGRNAAGEPTVEGTAMVAHSTAFVVRFAR